jgi:hypothetical protein
MYGITQRGKNETRMDTQITIYKVLSAPMLVYGSENWVHRRSERKKS